MRQVMVDVWKWLSTHEWLAIWLEGIALVAIFILELRQFKRSNRETLDQLEIAKQQAEAARLTAQSLVNSERAWLTGDLEWPAAPEASIVSTNTGRIIFSDTQVPPDKATMTTHADLVLKLRNDGKTPAWIETVFAGMEISGREKQSELPLLQYIKPLVARSQQAIRLSLHCPGKPKMLAHEQLQIHITVNYRDIFEVRQMQLEFSINPMTEVISRFEKVHINPTS